MVTKISVCLEVGPEGTGAFVPSHPGCWVFGRTPQSALAKVETAIREWYGWVAEHGERVLEKMKGFELDVGEMMRVDYNPVEAGKPEPLFWSEVRPVSQKDIARTLRLMAYSRDDLLNLVRDLSDECLDWLPGNKPRTTRNCLRHIAYVEPWYITRLGVDLPCKYPKNAFKLLDCTRETVVNYLEGFPREKMRGIFQPQKDKNPVCNLWTARKMLRRLVDHERLHARYVEKIVRLYGENRR